ncbi:MAG: ATP-binding protein [Chloroflexota bacterium]|jgi:hypothetical protein
MTSQVVDQHSENPFTPDRPARKGFEFIGREEALESVRNSLGHSPVDDPVIICGPAGIGKTSLLYQLLEGALNQPVTVLYADIHTMDSGSFSGFLWQLAKAIMSRMEELQLEGPRIEKRMLILNPQLVFRQRFWNPLLAKARTMPLLMAWDNFDTLSGSIPGDHYRQALRAYLFDLLDTDQPVDLLLSVTGRVEAIEKNALAPFQLKRSYRLTNLTEEQTLQLIRQPGRSTIFGSVAEFIYSLTAGHPGDTHRLCHALYERQKLYKYRQVTIADVIAVLQDALGPSNFVGDVYRRVGRPVTVSVQQS